MGFAKVLSRVMIEVFIFPKNLQSSAPYMLELNARLNESERNVIYTILLLLVDVPEQLWDYGLEEHFLQQVGHVITREQAFSNSFIWSQYPPIVMIKSASKASMGFAAITTLFDYFFHHYNK